jgi:hypothetical protein
LGQAFDEAAAQALIGDGLEQRCEGRDAWKLDAGQVDQDAIGGLIGDAAMQHAIVFDRDVVISVHGFLAK